MAKKKVAPKKSKKKPAAAKKVAVKTKISAAKKKAAPKAKAAVKNKLAAKSKVAVKKKVVAKMTGANRKLPTPETSVNRGSQDVETVPLAAKSRVARAGTGSGDLQGISVVEDVDSESADELLEEGQAFEAGIVSGVERAGTEGSEVITHEVLEDDVPSEYDDEDRP